MKRQYCKAEREFLRCKCERCKLYRENMTNNIVSNYIQKLISDSLNRRIEGEKNG